MRSALTSRIAPNPFQPRREFTPEQLGELEESIRQNGLLQPLVVRPAPEGAAEGVALLDLDGEPVRLVQAWEGADRVVLVDAVRSDRPPGTVHEHDAGTLGHRPSPGVDLGGGHLLGISEAIALARAMDRMPDHLRVIGIEGGSFELGLGLTPEVDQACDVVAAHLATLLTPP